MTDMARGLIVAAPRSGSGKTVVTIGLQRALSRRGLRIGGAKTGPDYIDPAFHAVATGRPSCNLDGFAMTPAMIAALAAGIAAEADLIVAEGAMGLYDGLASGAATGATADIAAMLGWPVLLVLDASGAAQSLAAVAHGLASFPGAPPVMGAIVNRCASPRHRRMIEAGFARTSVPLLGFVPTDTRLEMPSRHLGLVQAGETADLDARIEAMADCVAAHVDLDAVVAGAGSLAGPDQRSSSPRRRGSINSNVALPALRVASLDPRLRGDDERVDGAPPFLRPPGERIAIARDAAFAFLYPHLLDGWRRAGAEMLWFSPLADEAPPEDADACWLPGGYPELHAGRLAGNARFLGGLRRFAQTRPVHGECGGYMVLGQSLTDADGIRHAMAELLPVETSFTQRKLNLGYRHVTWREATSFAEAGQTHRGHEFHYATVTGGAPGNLAEMADGEGNPLPPAGHRAGHVSGSFFHLIA
ncbi:cobyrinate a,c-diamide synthase [Sphingomonas ginsenosidivorax]|uniref:Cobyrinate a,c-diamide synthase n=2 Tax=Sphingomonas ginsenosidivorax TaxID=862135 RepID=A0A5C6UJ71_9SPHN|nr:cobyrinate a,c-diamide synthase [Sphingomonas ginsenosidivorax]